MGISDVAFLPSSAIFTPHFLCVVVLHIVTHVGLRDVAFLPSAIFYTTFCKRCGVTHVDLKDLPSYLLPLFLTPHFLGVVVLHIVTHVDLRDVAFLPSPAIS